MYGTGEGAGAGVVVPSAAVAIRAAPSRISSRRGIRYCPGHAVYLVARCGKIVSSVTRDPAGHMSVPPVVRVTVPCASRPSRYT